MFKQITAVILLVAFSLQMLNRAVVYIDYYANTAAYAKDCVNRALPMMHCNGKCQMMKKLKEQEKKDSQLPDRRSVNNEVISSKSFFASVTYFPATIKPVYNAFPVSGITSMPRSFFHPPGA